jgi:ABC-type antimicrobial peptide transport system permease subunit
MDGGTFSGPPAERNVISPGFFAGMGIPLLSGRDFASTDTGQTDRVVIVSESLAKKFLPGPDPVGRYLKLEGIAGEFRIVGVVGDVKRTSLSEPAPYYTYLPYGRYPADSIFLAIRTAGDPLMLVRSIQKTVQTLDKDQAMWNVLTMDDRISVSLAGQQFNARFVAACAALSLLLALIGVHGTVAYTAAARTKEIGIRMALGARAKDIIALLMSDTASSAIGGAFVGALGAVGLRFLFRTWSLVPATVGPQLLGLTFMAIVTSAILATLVAILKAARLEPLKALRN